MDFIMSHVPFAEPEQEERYRNRLQPLIDAGEVDKYAAFQPDAAAVRFNGFCDCELTRCCADEAEEAEGGR